MQVPWKYSEDNVAVGKNVNLSVAVYVTTQARTKLYEYLSKLRESVLYRDTDSVIFIQKHNATQTSKQRIIWATSQMSWGSTALPLSRRVCVGWSKNYAFSVFWPSSGKVQ